VNRPIIDMTLDPHLGQALPADTWDTEAAGNMTAAGVPPLFLGHTEWMYARVTPILVNFDPAVVTWNWAYTLGNLTLSASTQDYLLGVLSGGSLLNPPGPSIPVFYTHVAKIPPLVAGAVSMPIAAWNAEAAIYGWEIRIVPVQHIPVDPGFGALTTMQAYWQGTLPNLGPNPPESPLAYVIR
jgi:hypothetical protein